MVVSSRVQAGKFVRRRGATATAKAGFTLIEIMIVVLIIGILLAIAVPNFVRAREASRQKSCVGNLRRLQWAKDSYLMDSNTSANYQFSTNGAEIFGADKYLKTKIVCPGDGRDYTLNDGLTDPVCGYTSLLTDLPHTASAQ